MRAVTCCTGKNVHLRSIPSCRKTQTNFLVNPTHKHALYLMKASCQSSVAYIPITTILQIRTLRLVKPFAQVAEAGLEPRAVWSYLLRTFCSIAPWIDIQALSRSQNFWVLRCNPTLIRASWKSSHTHYSFIGQSWQPQAGSGDRQVRKVELLGYKFSVSDTPLNCLSLENVTWDKAGGWQPKS